MSWLPHSKRLLMYGIAASASAAVFSAGYGLSEGSKESAPTEPMSPSSTSQPIKCQPAFSSLLPLGKVLASWTTNFEPSVKWDDDWDRRSIHQTAKPAKTEKKTVSKEEKNTENEEKKKTKPSATRYLILVRHGQYKMESDEDKLRILTDLGREQAELTGQRLQSLKHPYTCLINSSMTRACESADIISKQLPDLPRESCDLLREGAPIPPEPPVGHWRPNKDFYEDGARIEAAFRKYFHRADIKQEKDSCEILVCHANVIRYFVCRALQFPPEGWLRLSLANCSTTLVVIRPSGRVSLRNLGDSGHLPADKISYT